MSSLDGSVNDINTVECRVIPRHVAIIMDGNSRWASARGLSRIAGHRAGVKSVRRCIKAAINNKIEFLTLYAFSSENWHRPPEEVSDLTALLRYYLKFEVRKLHRENIRIRIIGDLKRFDEKMQKAFYDAEFLTKDNHKLTVTLALSYGGRGEIIQAVKHIVHDAKLNIIDPDTITEDIFSQYLFASDTPDPDLIMRTSGECRLSNFLLWQSAYAELLFLEILWPDFNETHFNMALDIYHRRERRFGSRPGLQVSGK